jgi:hypothetical protein
VLAHFIGEDQFHLHTQGAPGSGEMWADSWSVVEDFRSPLPAVGARCPYQAPPKRLEGKTANARMTDRFATRKEVTRRRIRNWYLHYCKTHDSLRLLPCSHNYGASLYLSKLYSTHAK